jgi:hypothetical protein
MAWAKDADLGTIGSVGSLGTLALTTSSAAAANTWIFGVVANFGDTVASVADNSGSPLTWTVITPQASNGVAGALVKAWAPSGLAAGTIVTVTFSAATIERRFGLSSFTGGSAGSVTEDAAASTGSTTAWSGTATAATADALVVSAIGMNTNTSTVVDANSVEDLDFQIVGNSTAALYHRIVTGAGAATVGGTWASAANWAAVTASFDTGGGGGGGGGEGGGAGMIRPGRHRGRFPGRDPVWF